MKRRDFLKTGLKVGIAANALPLLIGGTPMRALGRSPLRSMLEQTQGANDNILVVLQLAGGNDGLNCVIPIADPNYKTLRPTLGIDPLMTLPLADHASLGFHPSMTGMSTLYGQKNVALLQGVGYANPSLSHFRGTDIWNSATDTDKFESTGWLGRWLHGANPTFPATLTTDPLALQFGNSLSNVFLSQVGGMGVAIGRVPTSSNSSLHNYDPIPSSPTTPYQELSYMRTIQTESEVYATRIATVVGSAPANKVTYPSNNTLATQLSSIARFIAGGMTTQIYMVSQASYDTHSDQLNLQSKLLGDLSAALLAFQQDLEALGIADRVAIMTYSEFGRRPAENGSGTDHGMAAPLFVIGSQVQGKVYGSDPDLVNLNAGNLQYDWNHDFRNIYATVMNEWLLAGTPGAATAIDSVLDAGLNSEFYTMQKTNGVPSWSSLGLFNAASQNAVSADRASVPGLMLNENYPNPAHASTTFAYVLPAAGPVQLSLYNSAGVEVERPVDGWQEQGGHELPFNVSKLRSGAYIYRLKTPQGEIARQLVVEH